MKIMHTFQATNTAAFGQNPNQKVQKSKKTPTNCTETNMAITKRANGKSKKTQRRDFTVRELYPTRLTQYPCERHVIVYTLSRERRFPANFVTN